jgi:hypothetical protein
VTYVELWRPDSEIAITGSLGTQIRELYVRPTCPLTAGLLLAISKLPHLQYLVLSHVGGDGLDLLLLRRSKSLKVLSILSRISEPKQLFQKVLNRLQEDQGLTILS